MLNKRARKARERENALADLAKRDTRAMHGRKLADHVSLAVASVYSLAPVMARTSRAFDGHTPLIVREGDVEAMVERGESPANFRAQGGGGCGRSRMGRVERKRGGGVTFQRDRDANASRALLRVSEDCPPALTPARLTPGEIEESREQAAMVLGYALDAAQERRERAIERAARAALLRKAG